MQIDGAGAFTVQAQNTKLHTTITGTGSIDSAGNVTGTVSSGGTNANVTGNLQLGSGNTTLAGSVYVTNGSGTSQLNVSMTK